MSKPTRRTRPHARPGAILAAYLDDRRQELLDVLATTAAVVARADGRVEPAECGQLADFLDRHDFLSVFSPTKIHDAFDRRVRALKEPGGHRRSDGGIQRQCGAAARGCSARARRGSGRRGLSNRPVRAGSSAVDSQHSPRSFTIAYRARRARREITMTAGGGRSPDRLVESGAKSRRTCAKHAPFVVEQPQSSRPASLDPKLAIYGDADAVAAHPSLATASACPLRL